jgi:hypothetical protein
VTATAAPGFILSGSSFTEGDFTVLDHLTGAEFCAQVTLCHANWSNPQADNPYVEITIDENGVHGHDGHTGPIFFEGAKEQGVHWGDIIPPVEGLLPDGLNWTDEGQAILRNHCNIPDVVETPTTTPDFVLLDRCTGNIVDSNDDDTTQIVPLAGDGNNSWEFTEGDGQNGPWTLEFTADEGFDLVGDPSISGDAGTSADCVAPADETLPNTGGSSLWVLVLGGGLAMAGLLILSGRGALGLVGLTGPVPIEAPTSAWVQTVATKRQVAAVQAKPRRGLLAMLGGLLALVIASLFGRRP